MKNKVMLYYNRLKKKTKQTNPYQVSANKRSQSAAGGQKPRRPSTLKIEKPYEDVSLAEIINKQGYFFTPEVREIDLK